MNVSSAFEALFALIHFHLLFDSECVIFLLYFLSKVLCSSQLVLKCDLVLTSICAAVDLLQRWRQEAAAQRRQMILPEGEETIMLFAVSAGGRRWFPLMRVPGVGTACAWAWPRPPLLRDETGQLDGAGPNIQSWLQWRRSDAKRAAGER